MNRFIIVTSCILFTFLARANDTTFVDINLNGCIKNKLKITVYSPTISEDKVHFVIPKIIPGTYMKINYDRKYSKFKAFTKDGKSLPCNKKDNHFIIKNAQNLYKLEYLVEQSYGDPIIWDNIVGCAGTIFEPNKSFLINYELITGYFEGFKEHPIAVKYTKPENLFGSTTLTKQEINPTQDVYFARNYAELIDNPILYCKADTSSFTVKDTKFHISVYSETGKVTAELLKPKLETLMLAIQDFCEELPVKDYHFIFYYKDYKKMKGMFKSFGLGSALEHLHSSVYYSSEPYDSLFKGNNWICAHEFLHTWTPITIHSQQIDNFNFDEPTMSKQLWFYEGTTDYLAALVGERYNLPLYSSFRTTMDWATKSAKNRKARSMTESSQHIIKSNAFNWISKMLQEENFYEKGKLISFCLDAELMIKSNGKLRLSDVMQKLSTTYTIGKPVNDDEFLNVLTNLTYPEMSTFFNNYVVGKELPPYQKYFEMMGWEYRSKIPSFGDVSLKYDKKDKQFYIKKTKKNTLGLKKGDLILAINEKNLNQKSYYEGLTLALVRPKKGTSVEIKVLRKNKELNLNGIANNMKELKHPTLLEMDNLSEEQIQFKKQFLSKVE